MHLIFNYPSNFFIPLKTKKKMFAIKMVSALALTFFVVLVTAGKMLGVPRKERNRLRRVERREGRLGTH